MKHPAVRIPGGLLGLEVCTLAASLQARQVMPTVASKVGKPQASALS